MAIVYGTFLFGGVRDPDGYAYLATYTVDSVYEVPRKAWYRIHVVGRGGDGGNGGNAEIYKDKKGNAVGSGGASGSTGAYAVYEVLLNGGDVIAMSFDTAGARAVVSGHTVFASHGVNGPNGYSSIGGSGVSTSTYISGPVGAADASGVVATGGNMINHAGVAGEGSQWRFDRTIGLKGRDVYYDPGIANCIEHPLCIYTPKERPVKAYTLSDDRNLGGAGNGGTGAICQKDRYPVTGRPGSSGGQAGVVIELGYN